MRLIKLILILAVSTVSLMSCIKRTTPKDGSRASTIESLDGPRVIRDTIIKEIIVEKEVESITTDIVLEQPKPTAPKPAYSSSNARSTSASDRNDNYDRSNSGFFDQYQNNYQGDPNRNLQPTTRIVNEEDELDEIQRKKDAIEKSIEQVERINQQQIEDYERYERERQAANAKAIEKAKEEQRKQNEKKAKPKGKTLDTDLLLNNR